MVNSTQRKMVWSLCRQVPLRVTISMKHLMWWSDVSKLLLRNNQKTKTAYRL